MEVQYRFGVPTDKERIGLALRQYLHEQEELGSPLIFTLRNVVAFQDLVWAYLSGSRLGCVVLAEQDGLTVGFAIAGEDLAPPRFDTRLGKVLYVWAVWVDTGHRKTGVGLGMLNWGWPRMRELGFEVASMSVRDSNQQGRALTESFGARVTEHSYLFEL